MYACMHVCMYACMYVLYIHYIHMYGNRHVNTSLRHTYIYVYIYIYQHIYIHTHSCAISLSIYVYMYTFLTLIKVWCGVPPVLGEALCDAWMANSKPHNSRCVYGQFQSTQFTMGGQFQSTIDDIIYECFGAAS